MPAKVVKRKWDLAGPGSANGLGERAVIARFKAGNVAVGCLVNARALVHPGIVNAFNPRMVAAFEQLKADELQLHDARTPAPGMPVSRLNPFLDQFPYFFLQYFSYHLSKSAKTECRRGKNLAEVRFGTTSGRFGER
jgi:hypothetical protein